MAICPWRPLIDQAFFPEKWLDSHKIAAVVHWATGMEFLWIGDGDGGFCVPIPEDWMTPKEIIYNLSSISPSERIEAIEALKQIAR